MLGLIYVLADFGRDKGLHSLTSGFATQMQILTEISVPSKSSEVAVWQQVDGCRACIFHTTSFLHYRWNG